MLDETQAVAQLQLNSIPGPPANEWTWMTAGRYPVKVHTDEWMAWDKKYGDQYRQLETSLGPRRQSVESGRRRLPHPQRRAVEKF
ncbi:hypothetical protein ACOMD4_14975 [Streptomyces anulatus]|uniref:hypothetical protein n=1 Tax=Streptomyces anulatus TaxID=1892 RepID=UPI003B7CB015